MRLALGLPLFLLASAVFAQSAPEQSPLPQPRPEAFGPPVAGALCGDVRLRGSDAAQITGERAGCGIETPVLLRSVAGVELSAPVTVNCALATTLADWIERDVQPRFATRPALTELQGLSGYVCRQIGGGNRLSEHASGSAIDISAFGLGDGSLITVMRGWDDPRDGPLLRDLFDTACERFGTVLGPDANDAHADHFHLDVAARRRAYCR